MKIYKESFDILKEMNQTLLDGKFEGRIADNGVNLVFLASMVASAGDGDHVEIGTLFGASAIVAALIKKELGLSGDVYCIDPYDDETRQKSVQTVKPEMADMLSGSPEALRKNAKLFDVELKLIEEYSDPWPKQLEGNTFATAYIDGEHLADMPHKDFVNLSERTSDFIGFDNYEEGYPDVIGGFNKAILESSDWVLYYKNASFAAMRRRLPPRGQGSQTPIASL